jgi:hypothetical protein
MQSLETKRNAGLSQRRCLAGDFSDFDTRQKARETPALQHRAPSSMPGFVASLWTPEIVQLEG